MKCNVFELLGVVAFAAVWWFLMLMEAAPSNRSDSGDLVSAGLYPRSGWPAEVHYAIE